MTGWLDFPTEIRLMILQRIFTNIPIKYKPREQVPQQQKMSDTELLPGLMLVSKSWMQKSDILRVMLSQMKLRLSNDLEILQIQENVNLGPEALARLRHISMKELFRSDLYINFERLTSMIPNLQSIHITLREHFRDGCPPLWVSRDSKLVPLLLFGVYGPGKGVPGSAAGPEWGLSPILAPVSQSQLKAMRAEFYSEEPSKMHPSHHKMEETLMQGFEIMGNADGYDEDEPCKKALAWTLSLFNDVLYYGSEVEFSLSWWVEPVISGLDEDEGEIASLKNLKLNFSTKDLKMRVRAGTLVFIAGQDICRGEYSICDEYYCTLDADTDGSVTTDELEETENSDGADSH